MPNETYKHPWKFLAPNFQSLLRCIHSGRSLSTGEGQDALNVIWPELLVTAKRLLRRDGSRNVEEDANDARQIWIVAMLRVGFGNYASPLPFHAYGYALMRHVCVSIGKPAA